MSRAPFRVFRETCKARVAVEPGRRGVNALNVETMSPADRCLDKTPREWQVHGVSGIRWLASGGDPLIFGPCSPACPRLCGHKEGEGTCWWCNDSEGECDHGRQIPAKCPECTAAFLGKMDKAFDL